MFGCLTVLFAVVWFSMKLSWLIKLKTAVFNAWFQDYMVLIKIFRIKIKVILFRQMKISIIFYTIDLIDNIFIYKL